MNNLKVTRKNIYRIAGFVSIFFIFTGSNVFAADKIGIINMQEIMQNSNSGKKVADEFKKFVDKKNATIKATESDLQKMKDELDKQRTVLKESAFKEKESIFQKKYRDYQLLVKDTEKEVKDRNQDAANVLIPEILKATRAVAEKDKYTLVVDITSVPIPYAAKEIDISKKVIEEFNRAQATKK